MVLLTYSNPDNNIQSSKIIKNYNVTINGNDVYNKHNDSDVKRYAEIRKLIIRQGELNTTGCLLDHNYIKNQYRLKAVVLCRQKELDADPKAIEHIEFVGQLKNRIKIIMLQMLALTNLTILGKLKKNRLKFFQGSVTAL